MIDHRLHLELQRAAGRMRRLRLWWTLTLCWTAGAVIGASAWSLGRLGGWGGYGTVMTGVCLAAAGACLLSWRARRWLDDPRQAARQVEHHFPDLNDRLAAAAELECKWPFERYGYLQEQVINQALAHARRHDWGGIVPDRELARARLAHLVSLLLCLATAAGLLYLPPERFAPAAGNAAVTVLRPGLQYEVTVEPGDTAVERGRDVLVLARFTGPLPANVRLAYGPQPTSLQRVTMAKSLDDPLFGGRIERVQNELVYRVEFEDQSSRQFRITVFDYPAVQRMDATVQYPDYTGLEPKRIEDTRRVTGVQGSKLTLICQLNKPVARAWLRQVDGDRQVELTPADQEPTQVRATVVMDRSRRYAVHLVDTEGRANRWPPEFVAQVLPNQRPQVRVVFPGRDRQVSPLEELAVEATVWDDFGVTAAGLEYAVGGQPPRSVALAGQPAAGGKLRLAHLAALEEMHVEPGQLVSYAFWAQDLGPDGKPRRTYSDLFFAEVRDFEHIYRQGQQPPGGQGQQGRSRNPMNNLLDLQKQIINATWKLLRKHDPDPLPEFASDVATVADSQQLALEQLAQLKSRLRESTAAEKIEPAAEAMRAALKQLQQAKQRSAPAALSPALAAQRRAYQALLALRGREHRVARGRQGQAGRAAASRADRQLQELQLTARQNRYETRRSATALRDQQAREQNQVLSRLRDLARRQADLNDRIRQLQSALQQAQDRPQQQEIQRRLKRLRQQQQELLHDLDELRGRMDRPENRQRMADSRRRLDQTRQKLRQATEALGQNQLSTALSAGTRAARDLEQLRDQFRKRAASQFAEDMKQMRQQARQLAEREQTVAQQLDQLTRPQHRRLRDKRSRTSLADSLDGQRQRLDQLLEHMRSVSQQAEAPEPLLSRQLYDTWRHTQQQRLGETLRATEQLTRSGFLPEARQAERQARAGIEELKRRVERAARSILGDQKQAIKQALEELQDLTDQLRQEVARADPAGQPPSAPSQSPQSAAGRGQQQGDQKRLRQQPESRRRPQAGTGGTRRPLRADSRQAADKREESFESNSADARRAAEPSRTAPNPDTADQPVPPARGRTAQAGPPRRPDTRPAGQPRSNRLASDRPGRRGHRAATRTGAEPLDVSSWGGPGGPLTGPYYRDWSDRLRDVEQMLEDRELQNQVARIRDRARDVRRHLRRYGKGPQWSLVRKLILNPLVELQQRLRDELARLEPKDKLVPIDRDPVPQRYSELVRQYYERLGSGK